MTAATEQLRQVSAPSAHLGSVAVVITVYNRLNYLDAAIQSVLSQTYPIVQAVVIDDGSKVDVSSTLVKYGNRVEFYRQENRGVSAARNLGVQKARAEWILFLDDDDFLQLDAIETLLGAVKRQGAMWAAGSFFCVDEHGASRVMPQRRRYESGDIYPAMIHNNLMGCPSVVLAHSDALNCVGGFDENFGTAADYDLWLSLAGRYPVAVAQQVVTNYRIAPGQMSKNWRQAYEEKVDVLAKHRQQARRGHQDDFDRAISQACLEYGDDLYLHGHQREARGQWRLAFAQGHKIGIKGKVSRLVKSYLPQGVLAAGRKIASRKRGITEGSDLPLVMGTGELSLREK